jgi:hypothetical protein
VRVFVAALRKWAVMGGGGEENTGTSKNIVEVKNISQRGRSKEFVALEGRLVLSQDSSFQNRSLALLLSACSSNPLIST